MKILEGTQTFTNRGENAWNMTGKKSLYYNMTNLKICIDAFPVIILHFHPAFYPSSRSILPRKCSPPFTRWHFPAPRAPHFTPILPNDCRLDFIAALRHSWLSVSHLQIGNMRIFHAFTKVTMQFLLQSIFSLFVSDNEELFANRQEWGLFDQIIKCRNKQHVNRWTTKNNKVYSPNVLSRSNLSSYHHFYT